MFSQSSKLILKPEPHFIIDGEVCPLRINRSARAKNMKLKIKSFREITLVLPKRVSLKSGYNFADTEYSWIREQILKLDKPVLFDHGVVFPILGEEHQIIHAPNSRGFVWAEDGKLFVTGHREHIPRRVKDWAAKEIKSILITKSDKYAAKIGVRVRKITVRDQRSRWGSCSSSGNLNFSWRLILMPEHVIDYIVAHEVAHLRHMNHSSDFWGLVADICPSMQQSRQWLKKNGTPLHKYGATN